MKEAPKEVYLKKILGIEESYKLRYKNKRMTIKELNRLCKTKEEVI